MNNNTGSALAKLNKLQAMRASKHAELAAIKARVVEMDAAMVDETEIDAEEYLALRPKATVAADQIDALDVAIKDASEAHRLSQWKDVLVEAREHAASRPDLEAEIMKIAAAARKKLRALDAKANEWNTANRNMLARIKRSPLRELRENEWNADGGSVPVVDGKVVRDFALGKVNDMLGNAMVKLDAAEKSDRDAAEAAAAGPVMYSGDQMMRAADRGVEVAQVAWEDANVEALNLRAFNEASAAAARAARRNPSVYAQDTAAMFPTTGR